VNLVFEFIKYHLNAKKRHGIHSPFVYDLTDKCFKIELKKSDSEQIENYSQSLISDNTEIRIQDFGAGSRNLGKIREVNQIFRNSSSKGKFGNLLYKLARHYQFKNCLEFGTSLGIGTLNLHLGNPQSKILSIEACPETYRFTQKKLEEFQNIELLNQTFDSFLNGVNSDNFDFVFIDGHHDGFALLDYLERLRKNTGPETIFLLDDIRWSKSMFDAWQKIICDENYHLTIDLFRMGLISPRPQQQKEHFVIRY
jgi:predicted O-methyltransferase YrrM